MMKLELEYFFLCSVEKEPEELKTRKGCVFPYEQRRVMSALKCETKQ